MAELRQVGRAFLSIMAFSFAVGMIKDSSENEWGLWWRVGTISLLFFGAVMASKWVKGDGDEVG